MFSRITRKLCHSYIIRRSCSFCCSPKPKHLICFKQWSAYMVNDIIRSAINLKHSLRDTHCKKLSLLSGCKVTILLEVNEPILSLAVSKAATLLGAQDNIVINDLMWEQDYFGRIFSSMSDAIFVSTKTHMCVQRFAEQSTVPILCMRSRAHSSVQALSTVMAIKEEYGCLDGLNISYLGPSAPVLNSYLLLCPMLGANIRFKCCCNKIPISPLLYKASEDMCKQNNTTLEVCSTKEELLRNTTVVIAGPTTKIKEKIKDFKLPLEDINKSSSHWIFFHSCPRGEEVEDDLFNHTNSRTFCAFDNMQFIAAALMANAVKGIQF